MVFGVDQSEEDICDCKGLRALPWQPNFGQNRPKNHKNGHNFTCKRHIHTEFGLEIGFVPSGNSSLTLPYTRDKGALPWQPIFGTKIAINAYKCISVRDSENVITYNRGFSWSTNPQKTFLIARV